MYLVPWEQGYMVQCIRVLTLKHLKCFYPVYTYQDALEARQKGQGSYTTWESFCHFNPLGNRERDCFVHAFSFAPCHTSNTNSWYLHPDQVLELRRCVTTHWISHRCGLNLSQGTCEIPSSAPVSQVVFVSPTSGMAGYRGPVFCAFIVCLSVCPRVKICEHLASTLLFRSVALKPYEILWQNLVQI